MEICDMNRFEIAGNLDEMFFRSLLLANYCKAKITELPGQVQYFMSKQQSFNELLPLMAELYAEIESCSKEELENIEDVNKYIISKLEEKINKMPENSMQHSVTKEELKKAIRICFFNNKLPERELQFDEFDNELYRKQNIELFNGNFSEYFDNYFTQDDSNRSLSDRAIYQIACLRNGKNFEMGKNIEILEDEVKNLEMELKSVEPKYNSRKGGQFIYKNNFARNRYLELSKLLSIKRKELNEYGSEEARGYIKDFDNLFSGFIGQVSSNDISGLKKFVKNKYVICNPSYDITELNKLIFDMQEYTIKSPEDNTVKDMLICSQQLRNAIIYQRNFYPIVGKKETELKNKAIRLNNKVNEQIAAIGKKVRNVDSNESFKRTLFLINSRCDDDLANRAVAVLEKPSRNCISKFINNKDFHDFADKNPDKVETLMWGFINQPKVFYNNLSWDAKIKIFEANQRDKKRGDLIANINVLLDKANDKNIDSEQLLLVTLMYDRASIFNCRSIVKKMDKNLLEKLDEVVKKFDLNSNEKEILIDYVYKNRDNFLGKTGENLNKSILELEKFCQDNGALTEVQKKIIESRPENERKKFKEAMKDPKFRELCVDEITAENLSCFLDDYQNYVNDVSFACTIIILDKKDLGGKFGYGIQNKDKKDYLRDLISSVYKFSFIVNKNYPEFNADIKRAIDLAKEMKNNLHKLREFYRNPFENLEGGVGQGLVVLSNEFLKAASNDEKTAINNFCNVIGRFGMNLNEYYNILKEPQKFDEGIRVIQRNNLWFLLKYNTVNVAECFVNLSAENEHVEKIIEVMQENKDSYKVFEDTVKKKRVEIITSAFGKDSDDYKKFIFYLKDERFAHSMIRHVNSPENAKTILKLVEVGLQDPSKVTTKDLEYARELMNGDLLKSSDIAAYFNNGGEKLVDIPKEQMKEVVDFLNSSELQSIKFTDSIKIARTLFKKIDEIKKDSEVIKKFIGNDVKEDKLQFTVDFIANAMISNLKYLFSNYTETPNNVSEIIDVINNNYFMMLCTRNIDILDGCEYKLKDYVNDGIYEKLCEIGAEDYKTIKGVEMIQNFLQEKIYETENKPDNFFVPDDGVKDINAYIIYNLKIVFDCISRNYDLMQGISNDCDIESIKSKVKEIDYADLWVSHITQNKESADIKNIVKKLVNVVNCGDENLDFVQKDILRKIPQDLVNACRDEIIIEENQKAIDLIADQIVSDVSECDFEQFNGNSQLAQAVAQNIIKKHPEDAVEVAQKLGRENPVGFYLMQNPDIALIGDQREMNERGPLSRVNAIGRATIPISVDGR